MGPDEIARDAALQSLRVASGELSWEETWEKTWEETREKTWEEMWEETC